MESRHPTMACARFRVATMTESFIAGRQSLARPGAIRTGFFERRDGLSIAENSKMPPAMEDWLK